MYETAKRKWWLSGLMSFFMAGLGQLYNGQPVKAAALYLLSLIAYPAGTLVMVKSPSFAGLAFMVLLVLLVEMFALLDAIIYSVRIGDNFVPQRYNRLYVYVLVFLVSLAVSVVVTSANKVYIGAPFSISSVSNEPTLFIGDRVFSDSSYRGGKGVERGDWIVFSYPKDEDVDYIKRVVGMPGETIEILDKVVMVDGKPLAEDYTKFTDSEIRPMVLSPRDNFGPVEVPVDSYFVLGDNRDNSHDSRFWGFVKKEKVRGRVAGIYMSVEPDTYTPRLERFGSPL